MTKIGIVVIDKQTKEECYKRFVKVEDVARAVIEISSSEYVEIGGTFLSDEYGRRSV